MTTYSRPGSTYLISVSTLVFSNCIPLLGVIFFSWSVSAIMFLYWFENIIIGFNNVLKMSKARGEVSRTKYHIGKEPVGPSHKPQMILFFIVHFGLFTFGHGVFVLVMFGNDLPSFEVLIIAAIFLFTSHAVSYYVHFIKNREFTRVAYQDLFFQPYKRVIIMHITIITGGTAALFLELPALAVVVLIGLKTAIDVFAHKKEHQKFSQASTV